MPHTIGARKVRNGLWQVVLDGKVHLELSSKPAADRAIEQIKKNYRPSMPQGSDKFIEYDRSVVEWIDEDTT